MEMAVAVQTAARTQAYAVGAARVAAARATDGQDALTRAPVAVRAATAEVRAARVAVTVTTKVRVAEQLPPPRRLALACGRKVLSLAGINIAPSQRHWFARTCARAREGYCPFASTNWPPRSRPWPAERVGACALKIRGDRNQANERGRWLVPSSMSRAESLFSFVATRSSRRPVMQCCVKFSAKRMEGHSHLHLHECTVQAHIRYTSWVMCAFVCRLH